MNKKNIILLTGFMAVLMVVLIFSIYNINKSSNIKDEDQNNMVLTEKNIDKTISISQKCRGCGKCAMIDSEHFILNQTTRKAEVISQQNLDSDNLLRAISMCPEGAITIN